MNGGIFLDGTFMTPGCRCDNDCECPCWQMLGMDNGQDILCPVCGCDEPAIPTSVPEEEG